MKLLLKILFFMLSLFQTNIGEAKVFVFDAVFSQLFEVFHKKRLALRWSPDLAAINKREIVVF
jgi:hypothetical protein